jgi:hypothetical protein
MDSLPVPVQRKRGRSQLRGNKAPGVVAVDSCGSTTHTPGANVGSASNPAMSVSAMPAPSSGSSPNAHPLVQPTSPPKMSPEVPAVTPLGLPVAPPAPPTLGAGPPLVPA